MLVTTEIQPLRLKHLAAVTEMLIKQLQEHHVEIAGSTISSALEGVISDPSRGFCLVALRKGECIGAAYVSYIWALEHGGHSAWLEELYVLPENRGGIGTLLLEAVLKKCQEERCAALDLEIDADHERVRTLYQRNGFKSLPRRRLVKLLDVRK